MIVTKWLKENCYQTRCLRCGEIFWVKKGYKKDFCLPCCEKLKEIKNDKRKKEQRTIY